MYGKPYPKGVDKKAGGGKFPHFLGISNPYAASVNPSGTLKLISIDNKRKENYRGGYQASLILRVFLLIFDLNIDLKYFTISII